MVNERELLRTQQALAEDKMLKTVNELQGHVTQLQSQLVTSEQRAESQVKRLESSLKANQQVWLQAFFIVTAVYWFPIGILPCRNLSNMQN